MRLDLTTACLFAGVILFLWLNTPPPCRVRDPGRWRYFCGAIDHDHPTPQGADFCREMRR
jgi:hypothetical protein